MKKPNFFIIGAPKAGTTALYTYLKEHPNIFMPLFKEPHYFARDFAQEKRGYISDKNKYMELFKRASDQQTAIGEASVYYLFSQNAIANIFSFDRNAKLLAMVRNPIDLVYSYHSQVYYVQEEDQMDFATAWRLQEDRRRGGMIPKNCKDPVFLQYGKVASQGEQIKRLTEIFPAEQIKIIVFDDFIDSTPEVYREVLKFLEVPDDGRKEFPRVNVNKAFRSKAFSRALHSPPKFINKIRTWVKKALRVEGTGVWSFLNRLNTVKVRREELDPALRAELADFFRSDIELLSKMLNRDLTIWLE